MAALSQYCQTDVTQATTHLFSMVHSAVSYALLLFMCAARRVHTCVQCSIVQKYSRASSTCVHYCYIWSVALARQYILSSDTASGVLCSSVDLPIVAVLSCYQRCNMLAGLLDELALQLWCCCFDTLLINDSTLCGSTSVHDV
jgi:hypothetical protein